MMPVIERFQDALGNLITEHVKVKGLVIVVETDGPEWASQIAFLEGTLCKTIEKETGIPIKGIQIRVRRSR